MSYCRFSNSDIYLYPSVDNGIVCCCCQLAPLVPTIFTTGGKLLEGAVFEPCEHCGGKGCNECMMHGDTDGMNHKQAIEHVLKHREAGHDVPGFVLETLRAEMQSEERS